MLPFSLVQRRLRLVDGHPRIGLRLSGLFDPSLPQMGPAFFIDRIGKEDPPLL
jgi:hypothetical protein